MRLNNMVTLLFLAVVAISATIMAYTNLRERRCQDAIFIANKATEIANEASAIVEITRDNEVLSGNSTILNASVALRERSQQLLNDTVLKRDRLCRGK
jgi:hypothetical protein